MFSRMSNYGLPWHDLELSIDCTIPLLCLTSAYFPWSYCPPIGCVNITPKNVELKFEFVYIVSPCSIVLGPANCGFVIYNVCVDGWHNPGAEDATD